MTLRARVALATLVLACFARTASAQDAQMSFRVAPFTATSARPLFKVDIAESAKKPAAALPSLTVVETALGPRLRNVALKLPPLQLADRAVLSQLGDQTLPRSFGNSPWSGNVLKRPMRGLSFSTDGPTTVNVAVGQLDATSGPPTQPPNTPGVVALAVGVAPSKEFSVAPRALVPIGSQETQATVGTAIRAEVNGHVSFISDVGAAGTSHHGWDPLAAAGVVGHWSGTELETSLLRGTAPVGATSLATVGSLDREVVRGLFRSIPGMTISAQASWSRPASTPQSTDTTVGSIGVAYDRLPIGVVTATSQAEDSALQEIDTTRVEWRRAATGGVVVRYVAKRQTPRDTLNASAALTRQVEIELPGWIERDLRNRVDVQAVLTENPQAGTPAVSSRLTGRLDVIGDIGVAGETEVGVTGQGQPVLRAVRLTSSVRVHNRTALQLLYTYQAPGPYVFNNQSFEARLSRSIPLFTW